MVMPHEGSGLSKRWIRHAGKSKRTPPPASRMRGFLGDIDGITDPDVSDDILSNPRLALRFNRANPEHDQPPLTLKEVTMTFLQTFGKEAGAVIMAAMHTQGAGFCGAFQLPAHNHINSYVMAYALRTLANETPECPDRLKAYEKESLRKFKEELARQGVELSDSLREITVAIALHDLENHYRRKLANEREPRRRHDGPSARAS